MRVPDFFIVGAPKCGTTALDDYLRQHPQVFIPARKEIHFFGADLDFTRPRPTLDQYLALFAAAGDRKRIGESSVWYLYSASAAAEILRFSPAARIIIMLRNPVEAMVSLHSQRVYNGTEDLFDFAAALEAEGDRRRGLRLPKNQDNRMGYYYREAFRYADQVKRYFDVFGRDHVRVILFGDFRSDTAGVFRDTCRFLDVDPDFQPHLRVVNANKRVHSAWLRDLVRFASPRVRAAVKPVVPSVAWRKSVKDALRRWNTRYEPRPALDPELGRRLTLELAPEVERLSDLLERDLSEWSRV